MDKNTWHERMKPLPGTKYVIMIQWWTLCSRAWERVKVGNSIFIPYYRKCIYTEVLLDPALCHESVQEFQGAVDMSSDNTMQGLTLVTEKLAYL